jgi:hypothetical protein
MIYHGHIENGVVVFDSHINLPEGAQVRVEAIDKPARKTLAEKFRAVVGKAENLPEDFAANHDHYIHGAPRE